MGSCFEIGIQERVERRLDVRLDDNDLNNDGFFLSRFNFKRFDVPGGVGSCFEIGTQEIGNV